MSELEIYKGMVKKMKDDEIKEKIRQWYIDDDLISILDYITNLQQKYDRALKDNVKESHRRMELENTLHKIMISDGETTTPILDLIKENERLKLEKDTKSASEIICESLHDVYKSRCEELQKDRDYWQQQYNIYANLSEDYKSSCEKAVEYINNYSVDKSFSFPLMKRWEENQVKSSIDYEFNDTLKKDLLNILNGRSDE